MRAAIYPLILFLSCTLSGSPVVGEEPQAVEDVSVPRGEGVKVEDWVTGLDIPWSLVFLPGVRALVSERPGRIRLIEDGELSEEPYAVLEDVAHIGEGGLMGLALHPRFPDEPFVYAMHTYRGDSGLGNRVVRLKHNGATGAFDRVVVDDIPGGTNHNGGRIAFGPDGMLYITTGETFRAELAQDLESLGGKILRVTPEGEVPPDNPFPGSPVYSYGHRNPQGIDWQPGTGELFASEHGPSGEFGTRAHDEINIIRKGENYGWPKVIGAPSKKPYTDPIVAWKKTTPPSGIEFASGRLIKNLEGNLFVATLRSEALVRIVLGEKNRVARIERWFEGRYGRLRDVVEGPEGALYVLTNNTDGRGRPRAGDDRILRILPAGD
jgi:quinoprotein glucose dehydrogenase